MPWKNGGGITHEIVRFPMSGDPFDWRVSMAQLDTSGPFSNFSGYSRTMVLLQGAGVALTVGDRHLVLKHVGDLAEFDGGLPTRGDLLHGPCTDLNLIVSTSSIRARTWIARLEGTRALRPPPRETMLVFALNGPVTLEMDDGECHRLQTWDLALVSPQDRGVIGPAAGAQGPVPLAFFASLNDNSP